MCRGGTQSNLMQLDSRQRDIEQTAARASAASTRVEGSGTGVATEPAANASEFNPSLPAKGSNSSLPIEEAGLASMSVSEPISAGVRPSTAKSAPARRQYVGTGITNWTAIGGTRNDTFTIHPGSSAVVARGHGVNTLIGPNASNTWVISGTGSGSLDSSISFSNIANLTGRNGTDLFQFTGAGAISGTVNGGAGANTIDESKMTKPITVNLATDSATNIGSISNDGVRQ